MDPNQLFKMEQLAPPAASASSHIRKGSIPGLRATWSHDPSASACHNESQRKSFQAISDFERIQHVNSSPPNLSRGEYIGSSGVSTAGSTVWVGGADEPDNQAIISELPPVDRGRGAWTYLLVAFLVEGLCWGEIICYVVEILLCDADILWFCRISLLLRCVPSLLQLYRTLCRK